MAVKERGKWKIQERWNHDAAKRVLAEGECFNRGMCLDLPVQTDPGVRQQRQAALQQQGPVRLPGWGLHGLLLPLPRVRLTQVRRGVPLRQEVALRAGGGGGWRDHQEQVCCLVVDRRRGLGTWPLGWGSSGKGLCLLAERHYWTSLKREVDAVFCL